MSTRDQLRLALAQSLMQQGGAPGSPLGLFGNLARQAAGFQLQKKALDDIEARKQAANQAVLGALLPTRTITTPGAPVPLLSLIHI